MPGFLILAFLGLDLAVVGQSPAIRFVDVSAKRGIGAFRSEQGHGTGAAVADFDDDGYLDIFAPQALGLPYLLYHNRGDGSFEEIAASVGLGSTASGRAALWLDYDADDDLDLMVAVDDPAAESLLTLYRQDAQGRFEDVSAAAGVRRPPQVLFVTHHAAAICAGDVNNDGWLDVYTGQFPLGPGHLLLNDGRGGFVDISESSGVADGCETGFEEGCRSVHQCAMTDFDGDGWTDIYIAVDVGPDGGIPNVLWINQHDNTFVDQAPQAGLDNAMDDMGIALGDYDNDGDLDVYVTNIFNFGERNVLFRNDSTVGRMNYAEVSAAMNVDDGAFGWGATFLDADLDGDLDLAATNGYRSGEWTMDRSRFFTNQQAGAEPFTDDSQAVGFADTNWGSSLLAADFDRDGDQDLLQTCVTFYAAFTREPTRSGPLRLLDNVRAEGGRPNHYLVVQPRMAGPNRQAIGAIVRARAGDRTMMRLITAGTSYLGQEPAEAFFGLGETAVVDEVTVEWPDGSVSRRTGVTADQVLTLRRFTGPCPREEAAGDSDPLRRPRPAPRCDQHR